MLILFILPESFSFLTRNYFLQGNSSYQRKKNLPARKKIFRHNINIFFLHQKTFVSAGTRYVAYTDQGLKHNGRKIRPLVNAQFSLTTQVKKRITSLFCKKILLAPECNGSFDALQ